MLVCHHALVIFYNIFWSEAEPAILADKFYAMLFALIQYFISKVFTVLAIFWVYNNNIFVWESDSRNSADAGSIRRA